MTARAGYEGGCLHRGTSAITVSHDKNRSPGSGGTAGWPVASGRDGRRRADQWLPGLPGRPRVLGAHGARLRVRPAGVRPLAGRRGNHAGRGHYRCDAAVPGLVPVGGPLPGRPGGNVYSIRDGRSTGYAPATINRRLAACGGPVRVLGDAGPGRAGPRCRAARRPGARMAVSGAGCWPISASRTPLWAAGPRAAAAAPRPGQGRDRRAAGQLPHRPGPGDRRADAVLRAALGRGARPGRGRRGHPEGMDPGDGQGRQGAPVPLGPGRGRADPGLPAGRAARDIQPGAVRGGQGPHRGQAAEPGRLRAIFRYHRGRAGVPAGHPHALRHSFGTARGRGRGWTWPCCRR